MTDQKVIKFSKVFDPEFIPETEATFKTPGMAQEMARRWNLHEELVGALEKCLRYPHDVNIKDQHDFENLIKRAKGGL